MCVCVGVCVCVCHIVIGSDMVCQLFCAVSKHRRGLSMSHSFSAKLRCVNRDTHCSDSRVVNATVS